MKRDVVGTIGLHERRGTGEGKRSLSVEYSLIRLDRISFFGFWVKEGIIGASPADLQTAAE